MRGWDGKEPNLGRGLRTQAVCKNGQYCEPEEEANHHYRYEESLQD